MRTVIFAFALFTLSFCSSDGQASGQARFALACAQGDVAEVGRMLKTEKIEVDAVNGRIGPCLVSASYGGHKEIVELMLSHNANINIRDQKGTTPLVNAVVGNRLEVVELLLIKGADANLIVPDASGNISDITALKIARTKGNPKIIKLLENSRN